MTRVALGNVLVARGHLFRLVAGCGAIWGDGRIDYVWVVGVQVKMYGEVFGVVIVCVWRECMSQVIEI